MRHLSKSEIESISGGFLGKLIAGAMIRHAIKKFAKKEDHKHPHQITMPKLQKGVIKHK